MTRSPVRRGILTFCVGLVVLAIAVTAGYEIDRSRGHALSSGPSGLALGGPFTLVDGTGATVTERHYRGKWLLIYFGYTYCPDVCPTTLGQIGTALDALGPLAAKVQPLFISVDPARDTPKVIADYTRNLDPRIIGLTGTAEQIDAVAREYGVYHAAQRAKDGGTDYAVDHSSFIYVIGPGGEFVTPLNGGLSGRQIADRVRSYLAAPAS